jgi:hypothetical protein
MLEAHAESTTTPRRGGGRLAITAFAAAFISTGVGYTIGNQWALPFINALAIYPFYLELILSGRRRQAVALGLMWALFLSQAVIGVAYFFPERAEAATLRGAEYRDEMFTWVETGEGEESSPRRFIPSHAAHFAVFCGMCLLTGGFAGLAMGAALLNYMNFYVGALVAAADRPILTFLFGWQPYAIIRVVSYIVVATALSEAAFGLVRRRGVPPRARLYMAAGGAGVIVDVLVKSLTAPAWSRLLRWTTGL